MRIALYQLNPVVGDLEGNVRRILEGVAWARHQGAEGVIFPELALAGYPPRDLLLLPGFLRANREALEKVARQASDLAVLLGFAEITMGKGAGTRSFNAAAFLEGGEVRFVHRKTLLPTYDVFDEDRYFQPGSGMVPYVWRGKRWGISICEEMWSEGDLRTQGRYPRDPIRELVGRGVDLIVNLSASPYNIGKERLRWRRGQRLAREVGVPFLFVNQVGGNDELIFDGSSFAVDGRGGLLGAVPSFTEGGVVIDLEKRGTESEPSWPDEDAALMEGLTLGLRDYVRKCGFRTVLVGLSGGVDSAVTVALAERALGAPNVIGVAMPSRYTCERSMRDARSLAENLGIVLKVIPIERAYDVHLRTLEKEFEGRPVDIAEENLQARIRGTLLMALSNKFGYLVLSTGNKSELSVGYCTLYGDMSGGLAVLSDLLKTQVYALARCLNRERARIPQSILDRPPTAELKENQLDEDTLPSYPVLDPILRLSIEEGLSEEEIVARGFDREVVGRVLGMVARSEYKRRQAAPGLRVTSRAFGVGWRMPVACGAWS
jgi:NAD+ synthetase